MQAPSAPTARPTRRCPAGRGDVCARSGTIDPFATSRMASTATRPSQVTLLPRVASSWPPPTAASHPSASPTGSASAGAAPPLGRRTGGWLVHPLSRTPAAPRRCSSSSDEAGSVPGPAAHTTRRPAAQEAWRRTSPADSSSVGSGSPDEAPVSRRSAASSRSRSSSKSATICSRCGEASPRTASRSSSVRCSSRSRVHRHASRCSSSISSCAAVASAAAAASTANSKPGGNDEPAGRAPPSAGVGVAAVGSAWCGPLGRSAMSDTCCTVLLGSCCSAVPNNGSIDGGRC